MNDNVVDMSGKKLDADNVIQLDVETFKDIDPKNIINSANDIAEEFEQVIIIGWKKETGDFYFASSEGSAAEIILDFEIAKRMIMDGLASGE